jgi:hypothetical protein
MELTTGVPNDVNYDRYIEMAYEALKDMGVGNA